ncbi:unnamed protein product [Tuber melanosporum]|uniref:(Perigord truffle) hypothetical protein n=1 Tax=Tuber melanosporum (strain Mel28) TaxID=656061 RepID=D5GFA7_TUBMM|nr:uncharacterized protein GSTUM_00006803001 [Tuber melanosporum]CAZ83200.1 unnamed protein product [Tuber melanosporum]
MGIEPRERPPVTIGQLWSHYGEFEIDFRTVLIVVCASCSTYSTCCVSKSTSIGTCMRIPTKDEF